MFTTLADIEKSIYTHQILLPKKTAIELGKEAYFLFQKHAIAEYQHPEKNGNAKKTSEFNQVSDYTPSLYFLALPEPLTQALEWYPIDLSLNSNHRLNHFIWLNVLSCSKKNKEFYRNLGIQILSIAGEQSTPTAIQISQF